VHNPAVARATGEDTKRAVARDKPGEKAKQGMVRCFVWVHRSLTEDEGIWIMMPPPCPPEEATVQVHTEKPRRVGQARAVKWFPVFVGAYLAAAVTDMEMTQSAFGRCPACKEANPIYFSSRPSRGQMYAIGGTLTGLNLYSAYRLKKAGKSWWWVPIVAMTGIHTYAAIHNRRIPAKE